MSQADGKSSSASGKLRAFDKASSCAANRDGVSANAGEAKPARLLAVDINETARIHSRTEVLSAGRRGGSAMARTFREIAIEEMLRTVEEAMHQAINWWPDLPPPMKEAIEQFRTQLGAAIDSVESVKRALDREVHETDHGKGPA